MRVHFTIAINSGCQDENKQRAMQFILLFTNYIGSDKRGEPHQFLIRERTYTETTITIYLSRCTVHTPYAILRASRMVHEMHIWVHEPSICIPPEIFISRALWWTQQKGKIAKIKKRTKRRRNYIYFFAARILTSRVPFSGARTIINWLCMRCVNLNDAIADKAANLQISGSL